MDDSKPQTPTRIDLTDTSSRRRFVKYWGEAGLSNAGGEAKVSETTTHEDKLSSNIAAAYQRGQEKRNELRRQYGMETDDTARTLDFEEDEATKEGPRGQSNRMDAF